MTTRRQQPSQANRPAAFAVAVASVMFIPVSALASATADKNCPKSEQATLSVASTELSASNVSHDVTLIPINKSSEKPREDVIRPASVLAPRAEAAIREAFGDVSRADDHSVDIELIQTILKAPMAGVEVDAEIPADTEEATQPQPELKTQLPGVDDIDLSHFKKQMFRRDI